MDALITMAKEIARKQLESAGLLLKKRTKAGEIFSIWRAAKGVRLFDRYEYFLISG
jgi:hypothetical protein